jgi:EAL domain-containing protein (putative c-di-GMP-specific phosphodiesterase class I)
MVNNISQESDLLIVADAIMELFDKPFMIGEQENFITVSAGIAIYPFDGEDSESLIKNADIAMYNAKDRGKNQYVLCSTEMKKEILLKMKLTNRLYRALEHNEFTVFYQPQISLKTNRISGVEALLRWNHPELGNISPGVFIPLAEQTGLINFIGEWVLKEACRQVKEWLEMGIPQIRMAVNISVNQLRDSRLIGQIKEILRITGLEPECLELEITESIAIKEPNYIVNVLNDLKNIGVGITIDDFGTEYSSLSRLKILPVNRIKMDMQFVHEIDKSDKDNAISRIIINLAKNLGLQVIAEGVEKESQADFLSQNGCDEVQGFLYYKPLPAKEVEAILKNSYQLPK